MKQKIEKIIKMIENDKEYKNNLEEYRQSHGDMYGNDLGDDGSLFHKFREHLNYEFDMSGIIELDGNIDLNIVDNKNMIQNELNEFNKVCGTKYKVENILYEIYKEIEFMNDYYNGNEFIINEIESLDIDEFISIIVKKYSLEQKLLSANTFIKAIKEVLE